MLAKRMFSSSQASPRSFIFKTDVLDLGHPRLEVPAHVLFVELELRLDVLRGPEVLLEERQTLVHRPPVAPVQLVDHPERALHLQPDSSPSSSNSVT